MSDWKKSTDPKTGVLYYFNKKTRTSQWEKPAGFVEDGSGKLTDAENPAKWKEARDPASGQPYWFNKAINQSTFTKPACLCQAPDASPVPPPPNSAYPTPSASSTSPPASGNFEESVRLAWRSSKDPNSGVQYWYNKLTKESRWDDPFAKVALNNEAPRTRSPAPRASLALKKESLDTDEPPPPPPEEPEDSLKQDLKAAQDLHHSRGSAFAALERQLAETSTQLEQKSRAYDELVAQKLEWEAEKLQLLTVQADLQKEVDRLTQVRKGEPLTLERMQEQFLEKIATLEQQNHQILGLLKHEPRYSVTSRQPPVTTESSHRRIFKSTAN